MQFPTPNEHLPGSGGFPPQPRRYTKKIPAAIFFSTSRGRSPRLPAGRSVGQVTGAKPLGFKPQHPLHSAHGLGWGGVWGGRYANAFVPKLEVLYLHQPCFGHTAGCAKCDTRCAQCSVSSSLASAHANRAIRKTARNLNACSGWTQTHLQDVDLRVKHATSPPILRNRNGKASEHSSLLYKAASGDVLSTPATGVSTVLDSFAAPPNECSECLGRPLTAGPQATCKGWTSARRPLQAKLLGFFCVGSAYCFPLYSGFC